MGVYVTQVRLRQTRGEEARLLLCLHNDTAELAGCQQALHGFLEAQGASSRAIYHSELAFEELFTNVIRHAYRDCGPMHPIEVGAGIRDDEVVLTVEDSGPPFDPTQVAERPRPVGIENVRIGGLGLPLVRMAAKRIEYARVDGKNRVTIVIPRT